MKNLRVLRALVGIWGIILLLSVSTQAATWHVSASVKDGGDGSEKTPFATLPKAIEAATKAGDASEIVIHAGVYPGDSIVPAPAPGGDVAPWVIRAATKSDGSYEEVVIDGGQKITEAQVVDAERGIYYLKFNVANYEPSMWEAETRTRYIFAADRRSVEAFAGTLAPEKEGLVFRTSDSKPPSAHDLGLARNRYGLVIRRPNVAVKGLHFRNFQLYFGVYCISIEAPSVTVDSCHAWNCYGLAGVSENILDAKILNSTARDVATGVKSYGKNTIVENCRFFRIEDRFVVQENEQDQCGIQFYTSNVQTARNNLCVGFQLGIFIKASGGIATLEGNTIVAPTRSGSDRGLGPNTWRPGSICRGNIVVGYQEPVSLGDGLSKNVTVAGNLIWLASNRKIADETVEKLKSTTGGENIVAPPLFIDAGREDYRLSPASAGATLGVDHKAIGALGAAPAGEVDKTAPTVRLDVLPPAQPLGLRTQTYFRKNTWIGGKEPELIEDRLLASDQLMWLSPSAEVQVRVQAEDTVGKISQFRHRLGAADWSAAEPFRETFKVNLPASAPVTDIAVQVADDAGNWSEPASVRATATAHAPQIAGLPVVNATQYGATIAFKTDVPCIATVEWGAGSAFDQRVTDAPDVRMRYDNDQGFEWTDHVTGPRTDHCLAMTGPVKAGETYAFRVKLGYGASDAAKSHEGRIVMNGPARMLHVATTGKDEETGGAAGHPFATLQYAVDRALPGDRVVVAPGIYTGELEVHHGGVAGHPIRIESAQPGGAVLDGRREYATAICLNNVAHVQISGFEIRWYRDTCFLAHHAEDVLVEGCRFWDRHWVKGRPSTDDGVVFFTCKQVALDHNVFFALNSALRVFETDGLRLTSNTAVRCFHRVASIAYTDHCYLRNNSFAFGSSFLLSLVLTDEQVAHFDSDYNNLAVHLREDALTLARKQGMNPPAEELLTRENGDFYYGESKGLAGLSQHTKDFKAGKDLDMPTLSIWREKTGQDKHSIAIHPRYVDPQNRDFRLLPSSPNIGKGEHGVDIGALGVVKK